MREDDNLRKKSRLTPEKSVPLTSEMKAMPLDQDMRCLIYGNSRRRKSLTSTCAVKRDVTA